MSNVATRPHSIFPRSFLSATILAHLLPCALLEFTHHGGCRRDDTVLFDIQSEIRFFFHFSVFFSTCLNSNPERIQVTTCSTSKKARVARRNMKQQTHSFFDPVLALSPRARGRQV